MSVKLTDDQFWALERWIFAMASEAASPPGFNDAARLRGIRDSAFVALTGKEPITEAGRKALQSGETG